ncbi:MAG: SufD family Fe-S cluster assembly protein [Alphaproteobacteria bacterium]
MDLKILHKDTSIPFVSNFKLLATEEMSQGKIKFRRQEMEKYVSFIKENEKWKKKLENFSLSKLSENSTFPLDEIEMPDTEAETLVFINGFYDSELSTLDERYLNNFKKIKSVSKNITPFNMLSNAYCLEEVSYFINKNIRLRIMIISENKKQVNLPILNLRVIEGSNLKIEEIHLSKNENFSHLNLNIELEKKAKVSHDLYISGEEQISISHSIICEKDSLYEMKMKKFKSNKFTFEQQIDLEKGSSATIYAGFSDYNNLAWLPVFKHLGDETKSNFKARAIGKESSYTKIEVESFARDGVINTLINQSIKGLYIDGNATFELTPNMLITGESTEGHHGASIEKLAKSDIFYLQTRGIPEKDAQKILQDSFLKK